MKRKAAEKRVVDAPKRIWLQHDPENDGGPFNEAHEVTWCADKINDNDIEYVRADLHRARCEEYRAKLRECERDAEKMRKGEFICQRCGIRKDSEIGIDGEF